MKQLYAFGIFVFKYLCLFLGLFNTKLGHRNKTLKQQKIQSYAPSQVHFHCASAGEYEQIAQVIRCFIDQEPQTKITLSFFSISGLQWAKKKALPYPIYVLPYDTKKDQKRFVEALNPDLFIIAKNELWFNLIDILKKQDIPVYLIAAAFKENHFSLKYAYSRRLLRSLKGITTINLQSKQILEQYQIKNKMLGDPRIDRILNVKEQWEAIQKYHRSDRPVIIYASVHRSDRQILAWIKEDKAHYHIVVPHEVDPESISYFQSILPPETALSKDTTDWKSNCILVNELGILAKLYGHSQYAYVGGGFGAGIHNILEAAVHDNIIFIGPKFQAFTEAVELHQAGGLLVVDKNFNIPAGIKRMTVEFRNKCISLQHTYMQQNKNVSSKIYRAIKSTL